MSTKPLLPADPPTGPAIRLSSVERLALQHLVSAPKPWNGMPAEFVPAPRSALARLLALGLVRSVLGETLLGDVQDDTPLWITPAGRAALDRISAKTRGA